MVGRASAAAVAAELALICACFGAAAQDAAGTGGFRSHAIPCGGDEIARGSASRVLDGRTFLLDDGREVRLAAIEVPTLAPLGRDEGSRRMVVRGQKCAGRVAGWCRRSYCGAPS